MLGSTIVYAGVVITAAGLILVIKPIQRLHVMSRSQGLTIAGIGVLVAGIGLSAPTSESRVDKVETRLDEFVPVWQFNERHMIRVAASPERAFDAVRLVRADEISLFNTLTWIRRGGRRAPQSILNAGDSTPQTFKTLLPPGFALAAMNFMVTPDGPGASIISTETRVFANSPESRRKFARYWRVIYPGSALIRRMWLRAVRQRATSS